MDQSQSSVASQTDQTEAEAKPVDWHAKYEKEHDRKKMLNKKKKKAFKRVKKLTKENQALKQQLTQLKAKSFIREHDYF
ncbi:hypothetical protein [Acetilactobacillus jinshanensis]|uniref:Uncharacterized protein n=1 Tax=Acetilactobacillus jinshanensis TaxID=1720083 RepID=A0A4P6ZLM2_9LACO|nr:hypothetical protein [Acetilactobacillus jinshanensis]QBP18302.1 hypothetical protein ELX58_03940 [Acetilactobacillus jinshanensis]URL61167.1 hypothetical protein HGK75_04005 [uncultured bacterium]